MFFHMPEWLTSWFGLFGVVMYLGSYAALQLGLIRGNGYTYALLNIVAAGSVAISLIHAFNLSSLLIQISWIAILVVGVTRVFLMTHLVRFTEEEAHFRETKFPDLAKHQARRFLNLGTWRDLEPGTLLTQFGKPVEALAYISSGQAEAEIDGRVVGGIGPNILVGEFAVLSDDPATATVRVVEPMRVCTIPAERLKRFLPTNTDVELALRKQFVSEARDKIVKRNQDNFRTDAVHTRPT